MPYSSYSDLPSTVTKFLTSHKASKEEIDQWIAIFNSCNKRGLPDSRCFAMANGVLAKRFSANLQYNVFVPDVTKIREETIDNRKAWVIPTTFTREGVQLRKFKPWDELKKTIEGLNGIPVSFTHPPNTRGGISHNRQFIIGRVLKAEADEKDKSAKGEIAVWQEDPRSQWLLKEIKEGRYLDGSVGFWAMEESKPGDYNGIPYQGIEHNFMWDHFAVGIERGACPSPKCGLLANSDCECLITNPNSCDCGDVTMTDEQPCINEDEYDLPLTARDLWFSPDEEYWDPRMKDEYKGNAVLTTKARSALPAASFCGPGRSFPAHDAAHVRNGLARLGVAKNFSAAQKASIHSCLVGKAKSYGVKVSNTGELEEDLYKDSNISQGRGSNNMSESGAAVFPDPAASTSMVSSLEAATLRARIAELESALKVFKENEDKRAHDEVESLRNFVKKIAPPTLKAEEIEKMAKPELEVVAKAITGRVDFSLQGAASPKSNVPGFVRNEYGGIFAPLTVGDLTKKGAD
jgi:Uncharacterized protein conserved in bacteria (DUF2213)